MARLLIGKGIKIEVPLGEVKETEIEDVSLQVQLDRVNKQLKLQKILNIVMCFVLGLTLSLHLL